MPPSNEFRNIIHLAKVTSSPRILNLNLITQNISNENQGDFQPFFGNSILNQIIVIKHRLRPGEEKYFSNSRYSATKIFLPYSPTDLRDGGKFAFLGEDDIEKKLEYEFNVDLESNTDNAQRDVELLKVLERLPSLDPFLLKTSVERLEIDVDDGYFKISIGDYEKIRSFVTDEFTPLAEAAFGDSGKAPERAQQIADKMWNGTDHSFLSPICALLNIKDDAVTDILFSWKGVLYYKFIASLIETRTLAMLKGMRTMVAGGVQNLSEKAQIDELRNNLINDFLEMINIIKAQIETYNNIYINEFLGNKNGAALKTLLENAPSMFGSLGASIGSVSHACSYWEYQYANSGINRCPATEFLAMIEDFSDGISTAKEYTVGANWQGD
jgi:hypothetical protein